MHFYLKPDNLSEEILCNIVSTYIASYGSIVLAYSGGLDSTVLLDILTTLYKKSLHNMYYKSILKVRALHINHGLNKKAHFWSNHCANECRKRQIEFASICLNLNNITNNIEARSRHARYGALINALQSEEVLLTAHHQDDQVETMFLAMKRGSGPSGLSSMSTNILFHGHRLIRPFLNCERNSLKNYAIKHKLQWIEDESNKDLRFDRNFLRSCVLPVLNKRWPHFNCAVTRSTLLYSKQESLINELLSELLQVLIHIDGSLKLQEMFNMSEIKRFAIIRRWLLTHGNIIFSYKQLVYLWQSVVLSRRDSNAEFRLSKWQIRRFQNRLYLLTPSLSLNNKKMYWQSQDLYIQLPIKLGVLFKNIVNCNSKNMNIQADKNNDVMIQYQYKNSKFYLPWNNIEVENPISVIRAPYPTEIVSICFETTLHGLLHIIGRRHGRKLKKIWQELHIAPWQRKIIPLLFYNDILIAALGVFITQDGSTDNHHVLWEIFWYQKPF